MCEFKVRSRNKLEEVGHGWLQARPIRVKKRCKTKCAELIQGGERKRLRRGGGQASVAVLVPQAALLEKREEGSARRSAAEVEYASMRE